VSLGNSGDVGDGIHRCTGPRRTSEPAAPGLPKGVVVETG
jgi:hypothetical protein